MLLVFLLHPVIDHKFKKFNKIKQPPSSPSFVLLVLALFKVVSLIKLLVDRMQRVLHSVLTKRMLLNLRKSVSSRSTSRTRSSDPGSTQSDSSWTNQHRNRTALSSVVVGVDTWMNVEAGTDRSGSWIEMTTRPAHMDRSRGIP